MRFGGISSSKNPFVSLLNGVDNLGERFKKTKPGQFLHRHFSTLNELLKDSSLKPDKKTNTKPEPRKTPAPQPETSQETSQNCEKTKATLRRFNPTIAGQNPFVSVLNGMDNMGGRFAKTEWGQWICQRLNTVNNWLKDSSLKTDLPKSSAQKSLIIEVPSVGNIRKGLEEHAKAPLMLELEAKPLDAILVDLNTSRATHKDLQAKYKNLSQKEKDWAYAISSHEDAIQNAEETIIREKLTTGDRLQHLRDRQVKSFESLDEAQSSRAINQANLQVIQKRLEGLEHRIGSLNQLKIAKRQATAKPVPEPII